MLKKNYKTATICACILSTILIGLPIEGLAKPYDMVPKDLWNALESKGVRIKHFKMINDMYDGAISSFVNS